MSTVCHLSTDCELATSLPFTKCTIVASSPFALTCARLHDLSNQLTCRADLRRHSLHVDARTALKIGRWLEKLSVHASQENASNTEHGSQDAVWCTQCKSRHMSGMRHVHSAFSPPHT